jgi:hypothetical protein
VKINTDWKIKEKIEKVNFHSLPLTKGIFADENTFIAGGFDKVPFIFKRSEGAWKYVESLDAGMKRKKDFSIGKNDEKNSQLFFK